MTTTTTTTNSWHEVGVYDLAAIIDFILEKTNQTQLIYTGYSQGGTSIFVLLSERPEYNEKIASVHLLAPAVFYTRTNPLITPLLKNINTIKVGKKKFFFFNSIFIRNMLTFRFIH